MSTFKQITARFDGTCRECNSGITKGEEFAYSADEPKARRSVCMPCAVKHDMIEGDLFSPKGSGKLTKEDIAAISAEHWRACRPSDLDRAYTTKELRDVARYCRDTSGVSGHIATGRKADIIRFIVTGVYPGADEVIIKTVPAPPAPPKDDKRVDKLAGEVKDLTKQVSMLAQLIAEGNGNGQDITDALPKQDMILHEQFYELYMSVRLNHHVVMFGMPGTGKTVAASQIAKLLGRPFYTQTLAPTSPKSDLTGFINATGGKVSTAFVRAFTEGAVYLGDEADNWAPSTFVVLNTALANGLIELPGGEVVQQHPDFVFIAAMNTNGRGAANGMKRVAQDAASLDRFNFIEWRTDEYLEEIVTLRKCGFDAPDDRELRDHFDPTGRSADESDVRRWVSTVQKIRRAVDEQGVGLVVGQRASERGGQLLCHGADIGDVLDTVIFKGIPGDQKDRILAAAGVTL